MQVALSRVPRVVLPVEVVERKGLGHPDTICDALAEEFSIALSRHYLDRFGVILHHNVDKVLLYGGSARPVFGGGEVLEPIEIYLSGRAVREVGGERIPVEELAEDSARTWLRRNLRHLDPDRHVRIHCLVRPGSIELRELFRLSEKGEALPANDTSCGVGHAPESPLEAAVRAVEATINDPATRRERPHLGEDVKVMGLLTRGRAALTLASAQVASAVPDMEAYLAGKRALEEIAHRQASPLLGREVRVAVNTGDDPAAGRIYLTVTGTSAESGDDGEAGRGNRVGGLITPFRPMTMESTAGKNPITHVGKLYNVLAGLIARDLVGEVSAVRTADVFLVSRIGHPVSDPHLAHARLGLEEGADLEDVREEVEERFRRRLERAPGLWRELIDRKHGIYL